MPYYDNFWHIDVHDNIPSPACLTVFVKLKTEDQLIRFLLLIHCVHEKTITLDNVR